MAKEQRKIKVISYVYVGDQLTPVSELNEEQKERLAVGLQWGLLTSRFGGVATFTPPPGISIRINDQGLIDVKRVPAETATA